MTTAIIGPAPVPVQREPAEPQTELAGGDAPPLPYAVIAYAVLANPDLKPADKMVLMALQKYGWRDRVCFPANGTIAETAGSSLNTVKRSLATLVEAGWIRIDTTKANPTGRLIVLVWMNDPARHPCPKPAVNQDLALVAQNGPALSGPNLTPRLSGPKWATKNRFRWKKQLEETPPPTPPPGPALTFPLRPLPSMGEKELESSLLERERGEEPTAAPEPISIATQPTPSHAVTIPPKPPTRPHPFDTPMTPDQVATAERFVALGGPLGKQAEEKLKRNGWSGRVDVPQGGPRPRGPGQRAVAVASVMDRSDQRSRANPETRAMIGAVVRGCPGSKIDAAVRRICREFDDGKSQEYYFDVFGAVRRGERSTTDLLCAYDRATGIKIRSPGAAFTASLRNSP